MPSKDARAIATGVRKGDRRALAKAITMAESSPGGASPILESLGVTGRAFVVGVTGPPGTGKSTLVDGLVRVYRKKGLKVGVVAVDPSSPLTGGALLGDRIRMARHAGDSGVFIRSMASRGWSGGLARAASEAIQLMGAGGFDIVFLETVGIGQSDIEVVGVAHTVLVVLMPGLGDEVQVSKAGLMEVGDVYVVNKSDIEGAEGLVVSLLSLIRGRPQPQKVVKVSALSGEGLDELGVAIDSARARFEAGDPAIRLKSIRGMILETARSKLLEGLLAPGGPDPSDLSRRVLQGKLTVEAAALRLASKASTSPRGGRTSDRRAPRRSHRA